MFLWFFFVKKTKTTYVFKIHFYTALLKIHSIKSSC